MIDIVLAEGIYVKCSRSKVGGGSTARESVMETLWFPDKIENGHVILYPVMNDLKRILRIEEKQCDAQILF